MGVGMIAIVPEESTDAALGHTGGPRRRRMGGRQITNRADHTTGAELVGDYAPR